MQSNYERALREVLCELDTLVEERHQKALNDPTWKAWELGLDHKYIITSRMQRRGHDVRCKWQANYLIIFPAEGNKAIHIWRDKYK